MALKKGNRVEFGIKGKTEYGTVEKGGAKKITVILDGGEQEVRGYPAFFRLSSHPLPNADEVNPMSDYSIKAYKEAGGEETSRFEAKICYKGKPVIIASNGGKGGPDRYLAIGYSGPNSGRAVIEAFEKKAKEWAEAAGRPGREPASSWISWERTGRPYGQTAKSYLIF